MYVNLFVLYLILKLYVFFKISFNYLHFRSYYLKKHTLKNQILKSLTFYTFLFLLSFSLQGQTLSFSKAEINVDWDVCKYYPAEESARIATARSEFVKNKMDNNLDPCSTFIVTYTGFTAEAEAAFQFAVDIWSNNIESSVPIRVDANFEELDTNVLGSAGPAGFYTLTGDGVLPNTAYPSALTEKLIGGDVDGPTGTTNDINATFTNVSNTFYFGTDGNTFTNRIDFVSVVLHELGHGLGMLGFGSVNDTDEDGEPQAPTEGALRIGNGFLAPWDNFIENGAPEAITSFEDPSAALLVEYTSNDLFSKGPITTAQNGGVKPSTHAPTTFRTGSSYSHWDEVTYPAGSPNALMTPSIANGEANHDPGVVTLGFMEDMGWSICGGSLSVEDFSLNTAEVSPNPFTSSITIRVSNGLNDDYKLNIIDINGRLILSETKSPRNGTLTLSNLDQLEDAFYFIKITNETNGTSITKKVIKN